MDEKTRDFKDVVFCPKCGAYHNRLDVLSFEKYMCDACHNQNQSYRFLNNEKTAKALYGEESTYRSGLVFGY